MKMRDSRSFRVAAVIPAAGLSTRMGAFKPLLPLEEQTVIEAAVASVTPYADSAAVVVGYRGDEVAAILKSRFGARLTIVENPDYAETDMLRSVQLGLRAVGECDAFFLLPADMPLVSGAVFKALIEAFDGSEDIVFPVINGRRGHPPLIASRLIPEILRYHGGGGLRGVFRGKKAGEVMIGDKGILTDLDTPEDYNAVTTGRK